MEHQSSRGSCLCGGVQFSVTLPSKWVGHCHCTRCQRAHGAAFVTWAGFEAPTVTINDADSLLHWYVASGRGSRGFCSRCGSPMFFKSEQWPGELHIARALFVEPLDRAPQLHGYYATHVDWVTVTDSLPKVPDIPGEEDWTP